LFDESFLGAGGGGGTSGAGGSGIIGYVEVIAVAAFVNNVNLTQVRGVPFLHVLVLLLLLAGAEGEWGHVVETLLSPALSATVVLELLITSQVSSALLVYTVFFFI
jgi:hypothetical protein